jgi:hypothetical protein
VRFWHLALAIAVAIGAVLAGFALLVRAQDRVTQRGCTDDGSVPICPDPARD